MPRSVQLVKSQFPLLVNTIEYLLSLIKSCVQHKENKSIGWLHLDPFRLLANCTESPLSQPLSACQASWELATGPAPSSASFIHTLAFSLISVIGKLSFAPCLTHSHLASLGSWSDLNLSGKQTSGLLWARLDPQCARDPLSWSQKSKRPYHLLPGTEGSLSLKEFPLSGYSLCCHCWSPYCGPLKRQLECSRFSIIQSLCAEKRTKEENGERERGRGEGLEETKEQKEEGEVKEKEEEKKKRRRKRKMRRSLPS